MAASALSTLLDHRNGAAEAGIERILNTIRTHLDMEVALATEVTPDEVVIRHADSAEGQNFRPGDSFEPEETYCKRILDGRLPYLMADTSRFPETGKVRATAEAPIGSHISVPLRLSDGRVYGAFCAFRSRPNHSLNERDLKVMHAFADLAAAEIDAALSAADTRNDIVDRVQWILDHDRLGTVLQPIYRIDQKRIVGVEALARFPDADERPPSDWFQEAAGAGVGIELELAAVRAALAALPYLPRDIYLAVNVSPETLTSGKLLPILEPIPPGRVVLEITEHAVVMDYADLDRALVPMRQRARIAIDDAGAGYSGLRHILDLRPDIIKLDMSLTRGIDGDPARAALATALVSFSRQIGSLIVAEGVETEAELARLSELGVDCAQGYFLRRPMPIVAASQLLMAGGADADAGASRPGAPSGRPAPQRPESDAAATA